MNNNGKIGVFDSGIGGVTVLKEIVKILPNEDYIYYSDSKNNPYGDKTDTEIIKICDFIVKDLLDKECKIIVIACNTASARAVDYLRKKYKNINFIAIEPAYKMVHDYSFENPTLIMATKGTIESEKFNLLFHKYDNHKTYLLPCVGLADIIEKEDEKALEKYLEEHLEPYKGKVKDVVLGCTHYPLIKEQIQNVLGKVEFFEGSNRLAVHLKEVLEKENLLNKQKEKGSIKFIDSSNSELKEERFFKILNNYL